MSEQVAPQSDRTPLGQLLLGAQLITQRQLDEALAVQRSTGAFLGDTLVALDHVRPKDVGPILARELRVEYVNPRESEVTEEVMDVVPESFSRQHGAMPLRVENGRLHVAMKDPLNLSVLDDLKLIAGMPVVAALSMERELLAAINMHFDSRRHAEQAIQDIEAEKAASGEATEELSTEELWTLAADAPVVRLVNSIIHGAFNLGVSDIHLEPQREQMRVRYRLDGLLYDHMAIPKHHQPAVVSRVKIMSRMNIAERRLPQDGRIPLEHHGKEYDLRVSTMPSIFGEKVVMRVLDKTSMRMSFEQLGFLPEQQEAFEWLIARPYGMILVTGPTGSGKSTTLYAALAGINQPTKNIITIEDPVEYQLAGVTQTQANPRVGMTFARGLRTMVRQDPDVIMVGEIRDLETAEIAINAALTGHLVLSTVHTNDAPGTVTRLIDMGIEPFLISSAVLLIVAQRLIRKVCSECREQVQTHPQMLIDLGVPPDEARNFPVFKGKGCPICSNTGYKGRLGLYEVMPMKEEVKELILARASTSEIKKEAIRLGMKTLRQSGIHKIRNGLTTVEEILRATMEDR